MQLLKNYPKETKLVYQIDVCTFVFIVALYTTAENGSDLTAEQMIHE